VSDLVNSINPVNFIPIPGHKTNKIAIFTLFQHTQMHMIFLKGRFRHIAAAVATVLLGGTTLLAQPQMAAPPKNGNRVAEAFERFEDTLKKQFSEKKLVWPPQALYVRSFKYDRQLEVWVKGSRKEPFKLFKSYKVCMQSGAMGPKRMEGDYQVPEGFYYINEFNPNSNYHLSLGLNYPNASDKVLSDSIRPGGEIYIHGNCVSTGCLPISDLPMEELYVLASYAKSQGQDFIPVHIYPVKYAVKKSFDYLAEATKNNQLLQQFAIRLKEAYDYFEEKKQLPVIMVAKNGNYVIN
jgi:murein L,D-transpeptidase YafK